MTKDPKRQAAGRKSRTKGSTNERALAQAFKDWWGWGEWARTPSSGGWATPQHREAFRTCGDIITTAVDFPFCVEAKKCEGWTLDQLLHNPGCIIFQWWEQVEQETPPGLQPLLVIARNFVPHAVVFDPVRLNRHMSDLDKRRMAEKEPKPLCIDQPGAPWGDYPSLLLDPGILAVDTTLPSLRFQAMTHFFKGNPYWYGRKEIHMSEADRPKPEDRPNVPEPVIPTCDTCRKPLTQCTCTDNDLKK